MRNLLLSGTALTLLASAAHASALRGSYASIEAGATWFHPEQVAQTTTYTYTVPTPSTWAVYDTEFVTGWAVLGSVGHAFDSGVRAELELGYRQNDLNRLRDSSGSTLPAGGEISSFTIMANALYDFDVSSQLSLSVGLGVGVEEARLAIEQLGFEDATWQVAYQGIVGANYNVSDRAQLFVNYRYLQTQRPDYPAHLDSVAGENQLTQFLQDLNRHTVTVGLRYGLWGASR